MRTIDESLMIIRAAGMPDNLIERIGQGDRAKLDAWATGLIQEELESLFDDEDEDEDADV